MPNYVMVAPGGQEDFLAHACPEMADGLGMGEVAPLGVATLYAFLTGQPVEEVLRVTDNMTPTAGAKSGPWVTVLPSSLAARFAAMTDDDVRSIAKMWLDEQALADDALPADCSTALRALRKSGAKAAARNETVFLWSSMPI